MNGQFLPLQGSATSATTGVAAYLHFPHAKSVKNDHAEDSALVEAALGDLDKFESLVEKYEAPLLRYILRISNLNTADAEDVLQEVFLNSWTNLNGYRSDLPFKSWIYRITHNVTISTIRKHKSRGMDTSVELDESLYDCIPSKELGLDENLDRKQLANRARSTLQSMPIQYREVLILKYFDNLNYESISDILRKPEGTVATLLHRAKKMFSEHWKRNISHQLA